MVLRLKYALQTLEGLVKTQIIGLYPVLRVWLSRFGVGPTTCIFNTFPGVADATAGCRPSCLLQQPSSCLSASSCSFCQWDLRHIVFSLLDFKVRDLCPSPETVDLCLIPLGQWVSRSSWKLLLIGKKQSQEEVGLSTWPYHLHLSALSCANKMDSPQSPTLFPVFLMSTW